MTRPITICGSCGQPIESISEREEARARLEDLRSRYLAQRLATLALGVLLFLSLVFRN